MCSGRVDIEFILRAFANGQDGVFIGGCKLDECNYVTHGNYDALSNTYLTKRILKHLGINPDRLRIEFMSGADGQLLAEKTDEFTHQIRGLGALGSSEGLKKDAVRFNLEAARKLIPYMRLVERERFRVPVKSKKAYKEFFESPDTHALFDKIFSEQLAISRIMLLLKKNPLPTGTISEQLGLKASDVSRHMITSSRHGMVRYDTDSKCYTLVQA